MNLLTQNFHSAIRIWKANFHLHRANRRIEKQIKRRGKELKAAIRQADLMHQTTGKSYFVLPDYNGVLQVLDKANVRTLKRAKIMDKAVTVLDLLNEAEYHTINTHFVVLFARHWEFFRGTILEAKEVYIKRGLDCQILGGFERIITIKEGKIIKH